MKPIEVGTLLGGVRLQEIVGSGSSATVYKGQHVHLGVPMAVKVMDHTGGHNAMERNRFLREARVAARLQDPAIVHVHDFGEYAGTCYLVMEFVQGVTLEQYLDEQTGPTPELIVVRLLRRIAGALAVAHGAGLVHRDLKPANILISQEGQLKVTDFGLAQNNGNPAADGNGLFNGTPAYVAPECVTVGARVDYRADLYSLGVMAYELAFGKLPFNGSVEEMLTGHLDGRARFDLPTHCSTRLIALIKRLMAVNPEVRVQSAAQLLQTLEALRRALDANITTTRLQSPSGRTYPNTQSDDFSNLVRFLEDRFGGRTSQHPDGRVVHSTTRDRAMVWMLLAGTISLAVVGYLSHGR